MCVHRGRSDSCLAPGMQTGGPLFGKTTRYEISAGEKEDSSFTSSIPASKSSKLQSSMS